MAFTKVSYSMIDGAAVFGEPTTFGAQAYDYLKTLPEFAGATDC